jgi:hypothetical protein
LPPDAARRYLCGEPEVNGFTGHRATHLSGGAPVTCHQPWPGRQRVEAMPEHDRNRARLNAGVVLRTTVIVMLSAIITLSPDTSTLSGIRGLLVEAARFDIAADTLLLDGGHVAPASDPAHTIMNYGLDLKAVISFCEATKELDGDTEMLYGTDLAIDLVVRGASPISCGEHVGRSPDNILVVVHPTCTDCVD